MATQDPMGTRDMTPREREQAQREQQQRDQQQRRSAKRREGGDDDKTVYAKGTTSGEWPFVQARGVEEQDAMVNADGSNTVPDNSQETASARANRIANEGERANQPRTGTGAAAGQAAPHESYSQAQARQQRERDDANKASGATATGTKAT